MEILKNEVWDGAVVVVVEEAGGILDYFDSGGVEPGIPANTRYTRGFQSDMRGEKRGMIAKGDGKAPDGGVVGGGGGLMAIRVFKGILKRSRSSFVFFRLVSMHFYLFL